MKLTHVDTSPSVARVGTAVVLLCLVGLAVAASGQVAAQGTANLSIQPADGEVEVDGQATFEVVVEGADSGVGAHSLEIRLADGDVAQITGIETVNEPVSAGADIGVRDSGTTAVATAAMGPNSYSAADEIPILELTVEGLALNESTELTFADGSAVGPEGGGQYETVATSGATVSVVEEADTGTSSDGSGPGFGLAGALVALLGGGYLLSRTRAGE